MSLKIDYRKLLLFITLLFIFCFRYPICIEFIDQAADCLYEGAAGLCPPGIRCVTISSYSSDEYSHLEAMNPYVLPLYATLFLSLAFILSHIIVNGYDKVKK